MAAKPAQARSVGALGDRRARAVARVHQVLEEGAVQGGQRDVADQVLVQAVEPDQAHVEADADVGDARRRPFEPPSTIRSMRSRATISADLLERARAGARPAWPRARRGRSSRRRGSRRPGRGRARRRARGPCPAPPTTAIRTSATCSKRATSQAPSAVTSRRAEHRREQGLGPGAGRRRGRRARRARCPRAARAPRRRGRPPASAARAPTGVERAGRRSGPRPRPARRRRPGRCARRRSRRRSAPARGGGRRAASTCWARSGPIDASRLGPFELGRAQRAVERSKDRPSASVRGPP